MTKEAVIMVGLPACGKSTIARELVSDIDAQIISTDDYIERKAAEQGTTYDKIFSETIAEAQEEMNMLAMECMARGQDIAWDQTNLGVKKRASLIRRLKEAGYTIDCIAVMPTNPSQEEDLTQRLVSRPGKNIPYGVIEQMKKSYVQPTLDEGFDRVILCDIYGVIGEVFE